MKYILDEWPRFTRLVTDRPLFLMLDFDGTLVPIADKPDNVVLVPEVKALLQRLSEMSQVKLAVVSGRSLSDLKPRLGISNAYYSGNHGFELEGPNIVFKPNISRQYLTTIRGIMSQLLQILTHYPGAFIEDKGLIFSLHYRMAPTEAQLKLKQLFLELVIPFVRAGKVKIREGKMVIEVRPPMNWHKGKVVRWLLNQQLFGATTNWMLPIYLGDDLTDEDAFQTLRHDGVTIFVGEPKTSNAQYCLPSQSQVPRFLNQLFQTLVIR